jgi:hypothetical protein
VRWTLKEGEALRLTEEQRSRVLGHLQARGVRKCPACGGEEFVVGEDVFTIVAGATMVLDELVIQGMEAVPVVSPGCGNMMLFWSEALSLRG